MELRDYLRILRAHWVGVALITLAVLALTAIYTFTQPKVYAADASGLVTTGPADDAALNTINDEFARSRATAYVKIATSRATAQEAARLLNLDVEPAALVSNIEVVQTVDTPVIEVTARAGSPREAQRLADAWVSALAEQVEEIENPSGSEAKGIPRVEAIESAALPTSPVSPRPERNLALGLAIGLLLGFAYAMVRNVLDRRLRSPEAVEQRFPVNVVGMVPESETLSRDRGARAAVVLEGRAEASDKSTAGEAFRKLRTNLVFMDVDNPPRRIVVTSPRPGDGKSTVSINLAAAVAVSGEKVVLVDADLRRPSLAKALGLVEGVGLSDVLAGRVEAEDALQEVAGKPNMLVLAAGRIPPNPSELLGSKAMRALVEKLSQDALVILDAPPLLPVTDAAVLTANASGALVVISSGRTVDAELGTALSHLDAVKGKALGVILNKVPRRGAAASYYAGYYYTDDYSTKRSLRQPSSWTSVLRRSPGGSRATRQRLEGLKDESGKV